MRIVPAILPCLLALAACGQAQPPAARERIADPEAGGDVLPVMGQERRIAVLAKGIIDGTGLAAEERYPARLEAALRARGVNARVTVVASAAQAEEARAELLVAPERIEAGELRLIVPAMKVPDPLLQPDQRHPLPQGVEELVAQSVDAVGAALPANVRTR